MLRTAASLSLVLMTACFEGPPPEPCGNPLHDVVGSCNNGGGTGGQGDPQPPAFVNVMTPYNMSDSFFYPVAVGGAGEITVDEKDAADLHVVLGDGPARLTTWQTTEDTVRYLITTQSTPGMTSISLVSDNFEPVADAIVTKTVRDVKVLPEPAYEPATQDPAYHVSSANVVVALFGDGNAPTVPANRLIDTTLVASAPHIQQLGWDHYVLPQVAGTHVVTLTSDSIGSRELTFDVVGGIDRIEATVSGEPAVGQDTRVCFSAYLGAREVIAPFELVVGGVVVQYSQVRNCTTVSFPPGATKRTVKGAALGLDLTVELVVQPES